MVGADPVGAGEQHVGGEQDAGQPLRFAGGVEQDRTTQRPQPLQVPEHAVLQLHLADLIGGGVDDAEVGIDDHLTHTGGAGLLDPGPEMLQQPLQPVGHRGRRAHAVGVAVGHVGEDQRGAGRGHGRQRRGLQRRAGEVDVGGAGRQRHTHGVRAPGVHRDAIALLAQQPQGRQQAPLFLGVVDHRRRRRDRTGAQIEHGTALIAEPGRPLQQLPGIGHHRVAHHRFRREVDDAEQGAGGGRAHTGGSRDSGTQATAPSAATAAASRGRASGMRWLTSSQVGVSGQR